MTIKKSLIIQAILLSIVSLSAQNVTVNLDEEHQTIRGFGGMVHNTWQGGAGLSAEDAKLAFGAGEGQLGLTALRIPVNENKADWSKELAAAKLAQSYGAIVYASPWNPPSNLRDGNRKIPESNWQAYVDHLNSFAAHMKDQGAPLYAISIQNEPDWCHEWTCWSADDVYKFLKNYGGQLRKNGTKVITAESFAYVKTLYDQVLNDPSALSNVDIIGAHFYASTAASGDNFFQYTLADQKAKNQERWMTEHYTESQGSGNMWRAYIKTGDQDQQAKYDTVRALDVGYEIHRGLVVGNFNQYTWWYIRRCYGLIMEKDFGNKLTIPSNEIGKVSKRGYVLSQYARFVRPGAIRVGATAKPMNHVFASAYKKEDSVVVVLINRDASATKTLNISVPGATSITSWTKYTTSATKNVSNDGEISATNGSFSVTLDKESIVTLVGTGPQIVIPQGPYDSLNVPTIPGKIEAENYDIGGQNKAYYDEESENKGKAYREEGVDIEGNETDGFVVGYTMAGEWMEYTLDVKKEGIYAFNARVSSGAENASFIMYMDSVAITDTIKVPQGADWATYGNIKGETKTLPAGRHILKIAVTGNYFNLDWIDFQDPSSVKINPSLELSISKANEFEVFNLSGKRVGSFVSTNSKNLKAQTKDIVRHSGIYYVKSKTGIFCKRISIVKE